MIAHANPQRRLWNERVETLSRARFEAIGAHPRDIRDFDDFARIPPMTKDEHRRAQQESLERHGNPYALPGCAKPEEIVRINATSGTTGTPTLYTLTAHDVAVVNEMHARKYWRAGIRPGHMMIQALPLAHGAIGEMVFTFLDWHGGPFMRYALGDLLQVWTEPCACGMPGIRFAILGRTDDMLTVKGVNVYPQAIANEIFRLYPRVTGAFRIVLDGPGPKVSPPLRIRIARRRRWI